MRVSILRDDPGFANYDPTLRYLVWLDGKPVRGCLMFDEEAGEVLVHLQDVAGDVVVSQKNVAAYQHIQHGKVTHTTEPLPALLHRDAVEVVHEQQLTSAERRKYDSVWLNPEYRRSSPALRNLDKIIHELQLQPGDNILDVGIGSGQAAQSLYERGFRSIIGVDISPNANSHRIPTIISPIHKMPELQWINKGYCIDVMEHIPPELVDATLAAIRGNVFGPMYFRIAMFEDTFGEQLEIGKLHLTVKPARWWQDALEEYWGRVRVLEDDEPHCFVAVCDAPDL